MKSDVPGLILSPPNGPLTMTGVAAGQAAHSPSRGCSPGRGTSKVPRAHGPRLHRRGREAGGQRRGRRVCFSGPRLSPGRLDPATVPSGLPSAVRTAGALVAASGTRTLWDGRLKRRARDQQDRATHASGPCRVATCEHRRLRSDWGDCGPGRNAGAGGHFLLQGMFPTQGWNPRLLRTSCFQGTPHCGATRAAPLCNQGAPKAPPTTPVLTGASRADARGHAQSRASLLCSALLCGRPSRGKASEQWQPRAQPTAEAGCLRRRHSAVQTLEASPSETEKLITLLDGKALRGEEPVITK